MVNAQRNSDISLNVPLIKKLCFSDSDLYRRDRHGQKEVHQAALAARVGVSESTISKLLNGRSRPHESIGLFLRAFPEWDFEDLFVLEGESRIAA